ncbi:MAG: cytochrome c family protein [Bacteroidetes bacterium]|nr:MAG: cytochrome c family protein [Bacteroidota bacterium]
MKKRTKYITLPVIAAAMFLGSCSKDPQSPGYEYFPDMYRTPALETNMATQFPGDSGLVMANRLPAEGSIARGWMPYPYPNTAVGDSLAGVYWKSPLPQNDAVEEQGKVLYEQFCIHCHGDAGKGDGLLFSNGKFPNKPTDFTAADKKILPEGHIYHVIMYGKNMMGSHSSQLNIEERWKVIRYVQRLQRGGVAHSQWMADQAKATADTTKGKDSVAAHAAMPNHK